jgi:hypothetical protein
MNLQPPGEARDHSRNEPDLKNNPATAKRKRGATDGLNRHRLCFAVNGWKVASDKITHRAVILSLRFGADDGANE